MKQELQKYYTVFRTTIMVDNDIKLFKKINNLISKYCNTEKERYRFEAVNILKIASNMTTFCDSFKGLLRKELIDECNYSEYDRIVNEI